MGAAAFLLAASNATAATVSPIQGAFGNVFPTLVNQIMDVYRSSSSGPWYVSFNLLANADVNLGALGLSRSGYGTFDITSIRLVTIDGDNVQFGTDVVPNNPFPAPIDQLVVANALSPGMYALEVSGSGDRRAPNGTGGSFDATDFTVRLQVLPATVPVPAASALLLSALFGLLP
jgi:hypothetical protein